MAKNSPPKPGVYWACDNSAFHGFNEEPYIEMLNRINGRSDCRWVTAPDVVGDHVATLKFWGKWVGKILEYGQIPAFVAQDGCTPESIPWDEGMECVFIGGSTRWKLGHEVADIVHEAQRRKIWVHMGRVNTVRRIFYAHTLGVDSIDGSSFSKWSEVYVQKTIEFLANLDRQGMIPIGASYLG